MRTGSHHPAWRSRRTLTRAVILTAASLAAANCLPSLPGASSPRLSERDRVIHLLSRTTYGVRPQDVEDATRLGRREWLERQLHPDAIPDVTLETRIASRPTPAADQRIAELAVRPPSTAPVMPNAALPDPAAARTLSLALETAVKQLEAAQQDLLAAQRSAVTAQERMSGSDLNAARGALQDALTRYRAAQQSFDAVLRRMSELTTPPTPIPNAVNARVVRVAALTSALTVNALVAAKLDRAVYSERQLEEVMTDFWFNHFNVYYNKAQVRQAVEDYEKNAIRQHVFGRFQDLLVATAQHPAMLVYLDNFQSTAPVAPAANGRQGRPQRGGLNENYARELMELHTLGVDGGYTQQDVIEVARAFTGWGIVNRRTGGEPGSTTPAQSTMDFQFNANSHDNGDKVVLGQPIAGGRGIDEGMEILGILAHHPSTAKHIATKLVRHFVSDDPPPELVDEIARVFLETDGDLAAVTRALFLSNEFYNPDHYRAKVKRPFEYVASALRVTGADIVSNQGQGLVPQLRSFRHLPYSEAAPTGYATTAEDWVSAGAMLARMNFGLDLVAGRLPGISLGPRGSSGAVLPAALPLDAGFDISVGVDGTPSPALQSSVQALLQRLAVGAQTDQLAALITEDLLRAPQAASAAENAPQGAGGRGGVPQEVVRLRNQAGGNAPSALVQRRGAANQTLPSALRALGLALGSPEFQRY